MLVLSCFFMVKVIHKSFPQKNVEMWTNSKNTSTEGFFLFLTEKVFHRLCKNKLLLSDYRVKIFFEKGVAFLFFEVYNTTQLNLETVD